MRINTTINEQVKTLSSLHWGIRLLMAFVMTGPVTLDPALPQEPGRDAHV